MMMNLRDDEDKREIRVITIHWWMMNCTTTYLYLYLIG